MRCPACGFIGFDHVPTCKGCGKELPRPGTGRGMVPSGRPAAHLAVVEAGGSVEAGRPPASQQLEETETPASRIAVADLGSLRKAGFWLRALAFLVDLAVVGASVAVGGVLVGLAVRAGGWFSSTPALALESLEATASTFLAVLIDLGYFTLFVGWRGQTPGKMLLRLRIIRTNGEEVGYVRAFVRWVGQILSFLLLGIGFLMIAPSRTKQGLHDRIADTYVVRLASKG